MRVKLRMRVVYFVGKVEDGIKDATIGVVMTRHEVRELFRIRGFSDIALEVMSNSSLFNNL